MRIWEDYSDDMSYEEPAPAGNLWDQLPSKPLPVTVTLPDSGIGLNANYPLDTSQIEDRRTPPNADDPGVWGFSFAGENDGQSQGGGGGMSWLYDAAPTYSNEPDPFANFQADPEPAWDQAIEWVTPGPSTAQDNPSLDVLLGTGPSAPQQGPPTPSYGNPSTDEEPAFQTLPGQRLLDLSSSGGFQGPIDFTNPDVSKWTLDPEQQAALNKPVIVGNKPVTAAGLFNDFLDDQLPQRAGSRNLDWNDSTYNDILSPAQKYEMLNQAESTADMLATMDQFKGHAISAAVPGTPEAVPTAEEASQSEFSWWQYLNPQYADLPMDQQLKLFTQEKMSGGSGTLQVAMAGLGKVFEPLSVPRDELIKPAWAQLENYLHAPGEILTDIQAVATGDMDYMARQRQLKKDYEDYMEQLGAAGGPVRLINDIVLDPLTYASMGLNKLLVGAKTADEAGVALNVWQQRAENLPGLVKLVIDNGDLPTIVGFNVAGELINRSHILDNLDPASQMVLTMLGSAALGVGGAEIAKNPGMVTDKLASAYRTADTLAAMQIARDYPGMLTAAKDGQLDSGVAIWRANAADLVLRGRLAAGFAVEQPGAVLDALAAAVKRKVLPVERATELVGEALGKTPEESILTRADAVARPSSQHVPPPEAVAVASVYGGSAVGNVPAYIVRRVDGGYDIRLNERDLGQQFKKWQEAKDFLAKNGGKNVTPLDAGAQVIISPKGDVVTLQPYGAKGTDTPRGFIPKVNGQQLGQRFKTTDEAVAQLPDILTKMPRSAGGTLTPVGDTSTWRPFDTDGNIKWNYIDKTRATTELPNGKKLTLIRPNTKDGQWSLVIPGVAKGEKATTYKFGSQEEALNTIRAVYAAAGDRTRGRMEENYDYGGLTGQGDNWDEMVPDEQYTERGEPVPIAGWEAIDYNPEELYHLGIADAGGNIQPYYGPLVERYSALAATIAEIGRRAGLTGAEGGYPDIPPTVGLHLSGDLYGVHLLDEAGGTPAGEIYLNPYTIMSRADDMFERDRALDPTLTPDDFAKYYAAETLNTLVHEVAHYTESHNPNSLYIRGVKRGDEAFEGALAKLWDEIDDGTRDDMVAELVDVLPPEAIQGIQRTRDQLAPNRPAGIPRLEVRKEAVDGPNVNAPDYAAGLGNAPEVLQPRLSEADAGQVEPGRIPGPEPVRVNQGANPEGVSGRAAPAVRGTDAAAGAATGAADTPEQRLLNAIREFVSGERKPEPATVAEEGGGLSPGSGQPGETRAEPVVANSGQAAAENLPQEPAAPAEPSPIRKALSSFKDSEVGEASSAFALEAAITGAAAGLGWVTADDDEDRAQRAAEFALVGAAIAPGVKGAERIAQRVGEARATSAADAAPKKAPPPFGGYSRDWVEQMLGKDVADQAWLEWTARNAELAIEARRASEKVRADSSSVLKTTWEKFRDVFDPNAKVPTEALREVNAIEAAMNSAFEQVAVTLRGPQGKGLTKDMSWADRFDIYQAVEQPERYMRLLSPDKAQVAQTLRTVFDMVGRAAVDAGIFDPELVAKNPNYITHIWDYLTPEELDQVFKGTGSQARVRKSSVEMKREFKTIEEAINATDPTNRLVLPENFDPIDVGASYADVMYRRIAGERLKQWIEANHGDGGHAFVTDREWQELPVEEQGKYVKMSDVQPLTQPRFSNESQRILAASRNVIQKLDSGIRRAERWSGVYGDRQRQLEKLADKTDARVETLLNKMAATAPKETDRVNLAKEIFQQRDEELRQSMSLLGEAIGTRTKARIGQREATEAYKAAVDQLAAMEIRRANLEKRLGDVSIEDVSAFTEEQARLAERMRTLSTRINTASNVAARLGQKADIASDLRGIYDELTGGLRTEARRDVREAEQAAKDLGRASEYPLSSKIDARITELEQRIKQLEGMAANNKKKTPGLQAKIAALQDTRDNVAALRDELITRERSESAPLLVHKSYQPIFERFKPGYESNKILGAMKEMAGSLTRTILSGPIDLYMIGATAKTAVGMGFTPGMNSVSPEQASRALWHAAIAAVNPDHRAELIRANAGVREKLRAAGMGLGVESHDILRMVRGHENETLVGRALPGPLAKHYETLTQAMEGAQFTGWVDTLKTMLGADVAARHMKAGLDEASAWEKAAKTMDMAFGGKNLRATGHKTATMDTLRFLLLAPNWFMTRAELFTDAVNPNSGLNSFGKQWAVQTAFMGGLATYMAGAAYSAMKNGGEPDWDQVDSDWWASMRDPRHFMELKTPDGQWVSLLNWEKDFIRFPAAAYYAARGDTDAANEALGPYVKARINVLPRLLYDLGANRTFAGQRIYDKPSGIFDIKGMAKAALQIGKNVAIESQPQIFSEAERTLPNALLNKVLPGNPLDPSKTLGQSMGQGKNTPQGFVQNMTGLGRARTLTPVQEALQKDIDDGVLPADTRDYSRLDATQKKEFKLRHPELESYFNQGLPESYVDTIAKVKEQSEANDAAALNDEITVGDWKKAYGDYAKTRAVAGDLTFPDGSSPKNDEQRQILNDWYSAYDRATDARGQLDGDQLDQYQDEFFQKWGKAGVDLVDNYSLLGKSDIAALHTQVIRKLADDGYFDMARIDPEWRSTKLPESQLLELKTRIDTEAAKDPESQYYDAQTKLWVYGEQLGLDDDTIWDISLLNSSKAANPVWTQYKEDHPGLMSWLAGNLYFSGTKALLAREGISVK